MFDIHLTKTIPPELPPGVRAVYGCIQIDNHRETFTSSLVFWEPEDYERQWIVALDRIAIGAAESILVTSYVEPISGGFLTTWPLYREGETIHIQNQMLFFDHLKTPFSPEYPWQLIAQRKTINSEGIPISEWNTTRQDILECLARKQRGQMKGAANN